jgi:PHD/YefM family antitoxin component YafN of YafNO toxin-antitoxin module
LSDDPKKRIAVVKNSKLQAMIISVKEYERLMDAYDVLEKLYKKGLK